MRFVRLHQQFAQMVVLHFEIHNQLVLLLQQLVGQIGRSKANVVRRLSNVALGQRVRCVSFALEVNLNVQLLAGHHRDDTADHDHDDLGHLRLRDRSAEQMNNIVALRTDHLVDRRVQQQQQRDLVEQQVRQLTQEGRVLIVLVVAVELQFSMIVAIQVDLEDQAQQTNGQVRKVDHRARTRRVQQRIVVFDVDDVVEYQCENRVDHLIVWIEIGC